MPVAGETNILPPQITMNDDLNQLTVNLVVCIGLLILVMLSYSPSSLFDAPQAKPASLNRFRKQLERLKKPELSEATKLLLDPDPFAIVWEARRQVARILHVPLD